MRDLWTAKRGQQAHHKRHHDTPDERTTVVGRPQRAVVRRLRALVRCNVARMANDFRVYDGRTTGLLGSFRSRAAAWAAADAHLLELLAASGDWVLGEYLVVSRDHRGAVDVESQITYLGPADDLDACRRWLLTLPGRS